MKLRLIMLTIPHFSPFNAMLTDFPSYTMARGGYTAFPNGNDAISASGENKLLFIRTDSIFPFFSGLHYTSETITRKPVIPIISDVKKDRATPGDTISKTLLPNQKINIVGYNFKSATKTASRRVAISFKASDESDLIAFVAPALTESG